MIPPRPFRELRELPDELRVPRWFGFAVAAAVVAGVASGALTGDGTLAWRITRCTLRASMYAYVVISVVDFAEHFRLERALTGKWTTFQAVPLGESLNHAGTVATILGFLLLARRPPDPLEARDYFVCAAPAIFLLLGWRDELVYHRRRSVHREDILHTTAHLALGVMFSAFVMELWL